jgi:hypothetical protein
VHHGSRAEGTTAFNPSFVCSDGVFAVFTNKFIVIGCGKGQACPGVSRQNLIIVTVSVFKAYFGFSSTDFFCGGWA